MNTQLYALDIHSIAFPPIEHALIEPNGLLAVGGDLSPDRIIHAYKHGIFPWFGSNDPLMWWSPDPRAIIYTDKVRVNKSLRKFLVKSTYSITFNQAFERVITACADENYRQDGTWILPEMNAAYSALHKRGFAHSVEVWQKHELVGGLYGVAINGYFSGESMFHRAPNASKQALVALCEKLQSQGVNFIDCQMQNPFLASMGCVEISRDEFLSLKDTMLAKLINQDIWSCR